MGQPALILTHPKFKKPESLLSPRFPGADYRTFRLKLGLSEKDFARSAKISLHDLISYEEDRCKARITVMNKILACFYLNGITFNQNEL